MFKAAVITVSDRSFRGERPDTSGPLVVELLQTAGYDVRTTLVVPDEQVRIEAALRSYCDEQPVDLIITTGGTGFSPRDMTPEATIAVCQRLTPGIPEAMRHFSIQITPRSMLSPALPKPPRKIWKRFSPPWLMGWRCLLENRLTVQLWSINLS